MYESMAEDHGPQKPGNSTGPRPEIEDRQTVAKVQAAQRVRSWTVQNKTRGVPRFMTANAA